VDRHILWEISKPKRNQINLKKSQSMMMARYTLHVMFASNYEVQHKPKEWTFYIQYYEKQLSNLIYTQHEKWKKTGTKQFKKLR
jgi:hypothetical protein